MSDTPLRPANTFRPGLLIASPQLRDPNFSGTVVLLWHHDQQGAMGAIVNRATDLDLSEITEQLALPAPDAPTAVHFGGPVQPENGFLVYEGQVDERMGWNPRPDIAVTSSQEILEQVLKEKADFLLCLGYSGWGPGQLEREIEEGSWLYTELDPRILFGMSADERYDEAMASLGLDPRQIWMMQPISE